MERRSSDFPITRKLVKLAELLEALQPQRAHGRGIGLTNGCFDLFHVGHVAMLQEAASYCDDLIVAVDGDSLTRANKGDGRPLYSYPFRAATVAALECVWRVIEIGRTGKGESWLPGLIEAIRPTVYICRQVEEVPEIPAAVAAGALIIRLPRHGDWSTSALIHRFMKADVTGVGEPA